MEEIVNLFRAYATTKGYRFIYGNEIFLNAEATMRDMTGGEFLMCLFPIRRKRLFNSNAGIPSGWSVSAQIWIGRKFDTSSTTGTKSSIDETLEQKSDRRLFDIDSEFTDMEKDFFCASAYVLKAWDLQPFINETNENIDFIAAATIFETN